jgi:hypothetical protein
MEGEVFVLESSVLQERLVLPVVEVAGVYRLPTQLGKTRPVSCHPRERSRFSLWRALCALGAATAVLLRGTLRRLVSFFGGPKIQTIFGDLERAAHG